MISKLHKTMFIIFVAEKIIFMEIYFIVMLISGNKTSGNNDGLIVETHRDIYYEQYVVGDIKNFRIDYYIFLINIITLNTITKI